MRTLCRNPECEDVFDNKSKHAKYCPECRPIMKRKKISERAIQMTNISREKGFCIHCWNNKATIGFKSCKECREKITSYRKGSMSV